jgi:hypothetical protein
VGSGNWGVGRTVLKKMESRSIRKVQPKMLKSWNEHNGKGNDFFFAHRMIVPISNSVIFHEHYLVHLIVFNL